MTLLLAENVLSHTYSTLTCLCVRILFLSSACACDVYLWPIYVAFVREKESYAFRGAILV
jgi:hypothetical protein